MNNCVNTTEDDNSKCMGKYDINNTYQFSPSLLPKTAAVIKTAESF